MRLKKCYFVLLSFLLLAATAFAAPTNNGGYNRMIVFGDSYSDNGNVFKLTHGKYPNAISYFKGRFSDGPVWSEYFARNVGIDPSDKNHFINLAYGQAKILSPATISLKDNPEKTYTIPDLSQQITMFLKHNNFKTDDLVVLFISANDFFDLTDIHDKVIFIKMADQETQQIKRLIKEGAQHIIVLNGRNVTYSPLGNIFAKKNAPGSEATWLTGFQNLILTYNNRLANNLKNNPQVFIYDTYAFDNAMMDKIKHGAMRYEMDNKQYSIKNGIASCYQNNQGDYEDIAGPVCKNPEAYFFYDRIHTTRYLSYLLAQDIFKQFIEKSNDKN